MVPIQASLVKAGTSLAAEGVRGFLQKLLGPALEEAGLILQDDVRRYRLQNQIKILTKARSMLEKAGISPTAVPLKTLLPLLENASLEQEDDLQTKWAALLANASSPAGSLLVLPGFSEILKQLSPQEARLLDGMYDRVCLELNRIYEQVDGSLLSYIGAAGMSHDSIGQLYVSLGLSSTAWVNLGEPLDDEVNDAVRIQRTQLGTALDNLMRLGVLYREFGTKYRDKYFLSTLGFQFVSCCRRPTPLGEQESRVSALRL